MTSKKENNLEKLLENYFTFLNLKKYKNLRKKLKKYVSKSIVCVENKVLKIRL